LAGQGGHDFDLQQWLHWIAQEKFLGVQVWKGSACATTNTNKLNPASKRQLAAGFLDGLRLNLIIGI